MKKGGVVTDKNVFDAPKGNISNIWVENSGRYLEKLSSSEGDILKSSDKGEPTCYWVDYTDKGAVVHLYPTPDKSYNILFRYAANCKARDMNGNEKFNLEALTDVVNIPEDDALEDLYMHCLYTKSMVYLIADSQDENYAPYEREFEEAYRNLLGVGKIEPVIVI